MFRLTLIKLIAPNGREPQIKYFTFFFFKKQKNIKLIDFSEQEMPTFTLKRKKNENTKEIQFFSNGKFIFLFYEKKK